MRRICADSGRRKDHKRGKLGPAQRTGESRDKREVDHGGTAGDGDGRRSKIRRADMQSEEHDIAAGRRDEETGEPGEKRLWRQGGESRGVVETAIDITKRQNEDTGGPALIFIFLGSFFFAEEDLVFHRYVTHARFF